MPYKQALIRGIISTSVIRRGQTQEVALTPQIRAMLDAGLIEDITPPAKKKPKDAAKDVD